MQEFRIFCEKRRSELRVIYDKLGDQLTSVEIKDSIQAANMKVSSSQLRQIMTLLNRQQENKGAGTSTKQRISFEDFCEALLFVPTINPEAVFESIDHVPIDVAQSEYALPKSRSPALPPKSRSPTVAATSTGSDQQAVVSDVRRTRETSSWEHQLWAVGQQLYYGGVAGVVSRTSTAPIDRLKVMAQARAPGSKTPSMAATCRKIYAASGARGFWRGNLTNCIKIAPETACKFFTFDHCKELIAKDVGNVTVGERFLAGGAAGALTQVLIYPLEVVKTRMNISPPGTYSSILQCVRSIYRQAGESGVAALYKGCGTSVAGVIPYAGIDLMTNSILKEHGAAYYRSVGQEPGVTVVIVSGMISSSVAMVATYPLSLVRTRLQASGMPSAVHYTGVADCVRRTLQADGVAGLYKGVLPNLLKVVPSASISYTVYDLLKNNTHSGSGSGSSSSSSSSRHASSATKSR
jgi:solute carrier family 25 phosphate transporter 23/24/25/41